MSRSGYIYEYDDPRQVAMWRGAVASAIRGKRGQAFLKEMLDAMDHLPEPKLIKNELVTGDGVCAIGAVAVKRSIDIKDVDPEDRETIASIFKIAPALAAEIVYMNDEYYFGPSPSETPEMRFRRMRAWIQDQIK